jgi:N-acetylglucosaminyldiphosphoundecaprenol N-acetyl-beta-D-mannosaminyltransferase
MSTVMQIERVNVLGVGISVINLETARQTILDALRRGQKGFICVTGVHGVSEAQNDAQLRQIHNSAFLCTPDGMPMVWMGRLHGFKEMGRVYGPDLMLELCQATQNEKFSHFLFGGAPGVAGQLKAALESKYPGLRVVGTFTPPFRALNPLEEAELVERVAACKPDIFWVGLSTPKQEKFMSEYLPKLEVKLMIGVGAAFDFHAGRVRQAPRWIQRSGCEWLYRLWQEPRRLWRRYLKNNSLFVCRISLQVLGLKKYALESNE